MLQISNLTIRLQNSEKKILMGVSLSLDKGEVHYISGKNGSGKSTLVNAIMGSPEVMVTDGSITLKNEKYSDFVLQKLKKNQQKKNDLIDITKLEPNERSLLGLFLANQYPIEVPGVSLLNYLRLIYIARRPKEEHLPVFKFKKFVLELSGLINYPQKLLERNLNEGFSGGEKKKTEILQMLVISPRYAMLDEIDSGLDRSSVKDVFEGLKQYKKINSGVCFIIISHYDHVQDYLRPDYVHEMEGGELRVTS